MLLQFKDEFKKYKASSNFHSLDASSSSTVKHSVSFDLCGINYQTNLALI
jgi:hypothetical protein